MRRRHPDRETPTLARRLAEGTLGRDPRDGQSQFAQAGGSLGLGGGHRPGGESPGRGPDQGQASQCGYRFPLATGEPVECPVPRVPRRYRGHDSPIRRLLQRPGCPLPHRDRLDSPDPGRSDRQPGPFRGAGGGHVRARRAHFRGSGPRRRPHRPGGQVSRKASLRGREPRPQGPLRRHLPVACPGTVGHRRSPTRLRRPLPGYSAP